MANFIRLNILSVAISPLELLGITSRSILHPHGLSPSDERFTTMLR